MLVVASSAYALGISPGQRLLHHSPGIRETNFNIVNTDHEDLTVKISFQGSLAIYMNTTEETITFTRDDEQINIPIIIDLPPQLTPGIHSAEIVVTETEKLSDNEAATISTKASVVAILNVQVPVQNSAVTASLEIDNVIVGERVLFVIPLRNIGSEKIEKTTADIQITDLDGRKVAQFSTEKITLPTKSDGQLKAHWNALVQPGDYIATATVRYDEQDLSLEKTFKLRIKETPIPVIQPAKEPKSFIDKTLLNKGLIVIIIALVVVVSLLTWAVRKKKY